ncbi:MAG: endonuclease/exonuclease/phosphatase family protein [Solirubrobacterales bacterium]
MSNRKLFARPRVATVALIAAGMAAFTVPTLAQAAPPEGRVKVMTRNLYLGASLSPALEAADTAALAFATTGIWNTVQYTDFPQRAKLLAEEIAENKPDLVGLQEVTTYREDVIDEQIDENGPDPGDPLNNVQDGPFTPATAVRYDFLKSLMRELRKDGADYRVVITAREADVEVPATDRDKRLTMRDVILAREGAGVKTNLEDRGRYDNLLEISAAGGALDVTVDRGWAFAEANVRGTKFRFLNTHLEAFGDADQPAGQLRESQAEELIASFPPAAKPGPATYQSAGMPVVAVGDFNSDDDTVSGDDQLAYNALTSGPNALTERSTLGGVENSCCFEAVTIDEDPATALDDLDHHIDKVFVTDPDISEVKSKVVGNTKRIASAVVSPHMLWPSDHNGVITTLQFPTSD